MRRGKMRGKIFGIALVFLMIGSMLGGLGEVSHLAVYADQVGEGFKGSYEGDNQGQTYRFKVEYDAGSNTSVVTALREGYEDYGCSWMFNHDTFSGHGKATQWSGTSGFWEEHEIKPTDRLVSLPQNFSLDAAPNTHHSPIPPLTYDPPTGVVVSSPRTWQSGFFRLADNGPALWTGHAVDMTQRAQQDIGIVDGEEVDFQIVPIPKGCPVSYPVRDEDPTDNLYWDVPFNYFGNWYEAMGGFHSGEDWNLVGGDPNADLNEPVYAIANGTVAKISDLGDLGHLIGLEHRAPSEHMFMIPAKERTEHGQSYSYDKEYVTKIYSIYIHITPRQGITEGASVEKGDVIGYIMNPGGGPHLHFEIRHPDAKHSSNWSLAGDPSNWAKRNGRYTGYYLDIQEMVDAGVRDPREFIRANLIFAGIQYLRTTQNENGSWQNSVGITSMAALAFLNAGYIEHRDPAIRRAIEYILNNVHDGSSGWGTYETSLAVLALAATHNPGYNDEIRDARDWLVDAQYDDTEGIDSTNPYWGGWSYGSGPSWADLSNTQFALMALDAAGLPKGSSTWTKAITYVSRCQNKPAFEGHPGNNQDWAYDDSRPSYNDGGFIYCPEWSFVGETESYGSITAGGIWSLRLCGVDVPDGRVQDGLKWLADNEDCSFNDNPGMSDGRQFQYYYYMSIAKALTMCFLHGLNEVNPDHPCDDWYTPLSSKLADLQHDDGHWVNSYTGHGQENIPEIATDFALLALQTRQRPPAELWMSIILGSNADLCVYDPQGRHARLGDVTIPGASFEIDGEGRQICNLKELEAGKYRIELTGTADGGYSLTIEGYRDEEQTFSETFEGTISEGEVQKSDTLVTSMVGALTIYVEEPEPLLVTGLPNVRLIAADPTVTQVSVSSLDISAINETYKPEEVIPKYAYLVDATGAGNFTLKFTDVERANTIKVYKIDPTSTPPNQWIELEYTTTADAVTFTMSVGDPPIVFAEPVAGPANIPPIADAGTDQIVYVTPPATTAEVSLAGSGSYDPDGDPLTYTWTWDGNTAHGVNPTIELPLGTTTVTLVVNDGELSDSDTVDITVEQSTIPAVGGEAYPINKVAVLAPWLALIAAIIGGATIVVRRRRAQS